ncbi:hypothetical protein [Salinivirga cyanobacteriivorans]
MKNFKITTAALILVLIFSANISQAFPAIKATANSDQELYTAIQQLMEYPEQGKAHGASGYVLTTFHVDEEGWITVKDVQGKKVFTDYVKSQLDAISIENPDLYGKNYKIKIQFDFQDE